MVINEGNYVPLSTSIWTHHWSNDEKVQTLKNSSSFQPFLHSCITADIAQKYFQEECCIKIHELLLCQKHRQQNLKFDSLWEVHESYCSTQNQLWIWNNYEGSASVYQKKGPLFCGSRRASPIFFSPSLCFLPDLRKVLSRLGINTETILWQ